VGAGDDAGAVDPFVVDAHAHDPLAGRTDAGEGGLAGGSLVVEDAVQRPGGERELVDGRLGASPPDPDRPVGQVLAGGLEPGGVQPVGNDPDVVVVLAHDLGEGFAGDGDP